MTHKCEKTEDLLRVEFKIDKMSCKVDSLLYFRAKIMGGAAVVGAILSFVAAWLVNRI